jgi:hypothetical protein
VLIPRSTNPHHPFVHRVVQRGEAGTRAQLVRDPAAVEGKTRFILRLPIEKASSSNRHMAHRGKIVDHFSTLCSFFS